MNAHSRLGRRQGHGGRHRAATIMQRWCAAPVHGARKVYILDSNPARLRDGPWFRPRRDRSGQWGRQPPGKIRAPDAGARARTSHRGGQLRRAQADPRELPPKAGRVCFFAGLPKSDPVAALDVNQITTRAPWSPARYSRKRSGLPGVVRLLTRALSRREDHPHTGSLSSESSTASHLMESGRGAEGRILPNPDMPASNHFEPFIDAPTRPPPARAAWGALPPANRERLSGLPSAPRRRLTRTGPSPRPPRLAEMVDPHRLRAREDDQGRPSPIPQQGR